MRRQCLMPRRQDVAKALVNRKPLARLLNRCSLAVGQGLYEKNVSLTLSGVFLSVLSGTKMNGSLARQSIAHEPDSPDRAALRRCETYRKSFPMTEIALPAYAL